MEIKEEKILSKKVVFALLLSSCIIAAFFAYLYVDISQKLKALSVESGIFSPASRSPQEIYDAAKDSVVLIERRENTSRGMITKSICSGFIYHDKKHIITVYSSVANADEIRVVFNNKTKVKAEILGFDEYSNIAVLNFTKDLTITQGPLYLGKSDWLHLEEKVHIVGKICGTENLLVSGEVNGINVPYWLKNEFPLVDVIKFSARALSSETLGAPLLNSRGEVIGMIIDLVDNGGNITTLGYAISSNMIKKIASSIVKYGKYEHLWLEGIWGIDVTPEIAEFMDVNFTTGFLVTYIDLNVSSKLAYEEKLQAGNRTVIVDGRNVTIGGDIIIKIGDKEVNGMYDIVAYLEENRKYSTVRLTVVRDGEILEKPIIWPVAAFHPLPD